MHHPGRLVPGQDDPDSRSFDTGEQGVPHAFHQNDGLMCGYCTPGFVTACKALLDKNPNPSLEEVKKGLEGNICRCGTYVGVMQAGAGCGQSHERSLTMAKWPENPRLINTRIPRLDGMAKATGKAKYPSDVRPEGTLFGVMLYSPYAHAKVKSIDISAAEKMPGVKAIIAIAKEGTTLRYHGDDIAAVAAETEEHARDAVRAIKVEYEILPHVATEAFRWPRGAGGL